MSNNGTQTLTTTSAAFDIIAESDTLTGQQREALKVLRSVKVDAPDEFRAAFGTAVTLYRDTADVQQAVTEAQAIVKAGRAAIDAHTSYRLGLVAQWLRVFPKSSHADVARALYGSDDNTQRKMAGRDVKAVTLAATAKAHGQTIGATRALSLTAKASNADVKAMTARVVAGESPEPPKADAEPVTYTGSQIVKAAERLADMVKAQGADRLTAEQAATVKGILQRVANVI